MNTFSPTASLKSAGCKQRRNARETPGDALVANSR